MSKPADLIARAILWKDDALLVNANRNAKTNQYYVALPGGHVDPGENCVAALKREIEEELGARAEIGDLQFVSENIYTGRRASESQRHELTLVFAGTISGETTREDGTVESPEKDKNFRWFSRAVESLNPDRCPHLSKSPDSPKAMKSKSAPSTLCRASI